MSERNPGLEPDVLKLAIETQEWRLSMLEEVRPDTQGGYTSGAPCAFGTGLPRTTGISPSTQVATGDGLNLSIWANRTTDSSFLERR